MIVRIVLEFLVESLTHEAQERVKRYWLRAMADVLRMVALDKWLDQSIL